MHDTRQHADAIVQSSCGTSCGGGLASDAPNFVQINVGVTAAERTQPAIEAKPFAGTAEHPEGLLIGFDVGSTTVKFVVVDLLSDQILHQNYARHDTKQPEKCAEMLRDIERKFADVPHNAFRVFMTGSGAASIAKRIGGRFVQEVNAVSLAVEKLYPNVQSVVELGGQDAKIIIFKTLEESGKKKKIPSMNDKCAGGTGAVIDKINAKLKIPAEQLCRMGYNGIKLHPVAGKCGVFAETDINGLQKQGVPPEELMASLFESIIQQNLSVLTRGHTLRPQVLLLGGPNTYIEGMKACWRHNIPIVWEQRKLAVPDRPIEELIIVPDNAQYFAALGAVEFAKIELEDDPDQGVYRGVGELDWYVKVGRVEEKKAAAGCGLWKDKADLAEFRQRYSKEPWRPAAFASRTTVSAFIGVDGGSTSTKGVLVDRDKNVIAKAYQLSKGNPIEDTMEIIAELQTQIESQGCRLDVLGVGTTGYAKDMLKDVIGGDVALVETVAHTQAGLQFHPRTDVIIDVGGQDIKLIILKNGQVKDFKLNTQCSAGNGYFLQSTAQGFGYSVEEFAEIAFSAEAMPQFGYGCAVFMQSDIVDFQRQGWAAQEIMAGLCNVLPKNIWLYISQIPNLAKLGSTFLLQGGTQHNLAAVKAQVDFITSRFVGTGVQPEVVVHRFCGEAGAIGCAVEAHRLYHENGHRTRFIGLERVREIEYRTTHDESTRCYFCKNKCLRTFIDVKTGAPDPAAHAESHVDLHTHPFKSGPESPHPTRMTHGPEVAPTKAASAPRGDSVASAPRGDSVASAPRGDSVASAPRGDSVASAPRGGRSENADWPLGGKQDNDAETKPRKGKSKAPLGPGEQRLIIATCEKGTVEDVSDMRDLKKGLDQARKDHPNFAEITAERTFKAAGVASVADDVPAGNLPRMLNRRRIAAMKRRGAIRIGLPRALNMYSMAPWFMAYFESLGIAQRNLIWSDATSEELYKEGCKRGAIDPCFPSKVGIPHVHNLLYKKHTKSRPLDYIFFPMIDTLPTFLENTLDSRSCPTVASTPEAVKAAFIKESDLFAELGIEYLPTFLNFAEPGLLARQLLAEFEEKLGLSRQENLRACRAAWHHFEKFSADLRAEARRLLDRIEANDEVGVVLLARPYHNDPGICQEIPAEFQKLGIPVFTMDVLPRDPDILHRLFGAEVAAGEVSSPLAIDDVWKNAYSENTNRKLWAAKYAARHPNLVALELSSFKCGHDAPIYSAIEEIIETSGTPYFSFKDIDENKPTGSIKIRVETIAYFLQRHREKLVWEKRKRKEIESQLAALETRLRRQGDVEPAADGSCERQSPPTGQPATLTTR